MSKVKIRDMEVRAGHLKSVPLQVTVPVSWLRQHCRAGDRLGLFAVPGADALCIDLVNVDVKAVRGRKSRSVKHPNLHNSSSASRGVE